MESALDFDFRSIRPASTAKQRLLSFLRIAAPSARRRLRALRRRKVSREDSKAKTGTEQGQPSLYVAPKS